MKPSSIQRKAVTVDRIDQQPIDPAEIRQLRRDLDLLKREAYKRGQDVDIVGDPDGAGRKPELYLKSPDGNTWKITVDNAGVISATAV